MRSCRARAASSVPASSWARPGSTSTLTKPSIAAGLVVDGLENLGCAGDVLEHHRPVVGDASGCSSRASDAELLVVVGGTLDRLLEDRRVGRESADALVAQLDELTRREVAAPEVVEPRTLVELLVQADQSVHGDHATTAVAQSARARRTTWSTLMPSLSRTTSPGALAPKRSMPIESSAKRSHPSVVAASTDSTGNAGREQLVAIRRVLPGEAVPRRQAHDTGGDAVVAELLGRVDGDGDLAAGGDDDELGGAVGLVDDSGTAARRRSRRCRPGCPGETARAPSVRRGRRLPSTPRRSRWRRPDGSPAGRGSPAAWRRARRADGSARPRRPRRSRG